MHRHSKRRYARTNGRDYLQQMDKIQRTETRLHDIHRDIDPSAPSPTTLATASTNISLATDNEVLTHDIGYAPYQVATSQKNPIILPNWLEQHRSDPAIKVSMFVFNRRASVYMNSG